MPASQTDNHAVARIDFHRSSSTPVSVHGIDRICWPISIEINHQFNQRVIENCAFGPTDGKTLVNKTPHDILPITRVRTIGLPSCNATSPDWKRCLYMPVKCHFDIGEALMPFETNVVQRIRLPQYHRGKRRGRRRCGSQTGSSCRISPSSQKA